jgi:hypothetical protein
MADLIDSKRIKDLEHALSIVMSLRIPVDNTSYPNAKYITIAELATAIGANTTGYIYPTAVKGLLDLNITPAEVVTADPYSLKKLIDPLIAYFYLQAVNPTFTHRVNLDGNLYVTNLMTRGINFINGTPLKWLTTDANGNVIFSNGPTPGSMNFIQDIAFDYPDITGNTVQTYILDLDASTPYKIISCVLRSDQNMTGIAININNIAITGLDNISSTNTKSTTLASAFNDAILGDEVTLVTNGASTATRLTGKLRIQLV